MRSKSRSTCMGMRSFTSASIGIAVYPHDADDIEELIKSADVAMYRAKEEGCEQLSVLYHGSPRQGDQVPDHGAGSTGPLWTARSSRSSISHS